MEIKNLEDEFTREAEAGSIDNINFSLGNGDTIEPILNNETKIYSPEQMNNLLVDFFSIRLAYIEESYQRKESDVNDLMFKLHHVTMIANEIKSQLPHPIIFKRNNMNYDSNEEDLNSSKMSTMSRRSNSSTRSSKKDFLQNKSNPRDKMALFSPKVAINIMFNQDKEGGSSSLDRSVLRKNSDGAKSKSLSNANNNTTKPPAKDERNSQKKLTQSPLNVKEKPKNEVEAKQGFHKQNARKVNSDGDNLVKKTQKAIPLTNSTVSNNNQSNSKIKPALVKGASNEKPAKTGPQNNQVINTKTNNNLNSSPKVIHGGGKSVGSNYNSNLVGGSKSMSDKKEIEKVKKNTEHPKSVELFTSPTQKPTYKFEPKTMKNPINMNGINNTIKYDEEKKDSLSSARGRHGKDFFDTNMTKRIFKFLMLKDKLNFKNTSRKFRKLFFSEEINDFSNKIMMKKLEENPCYFMLIPKTLEEGTKEKYLRLSDDLDKYLENPSYNNLVNVLYIIAFTGEQNFSKESVKNKFLHQKIEELERYISKNSKSYSVYSVFPYLVSNLKLKIDVYTYLRELYLENEQSFVLSGLTDDYDLLVEFLKILSGCLSSGPNMELVIDLEIFQHKLEILKTYSEQ